MRKAILLSASLVAALGCGTALAGSPRHANATESAAMTEGKAAQVPLGRVHNARELSDASVQDKDGNSVGQVHKVIRGTGGKPEAIQVDAGGFLGVGSKVIQMKVSHLKYEQDRNVIITNLTKGEMKALPKVRGT